MIGHLVVTVAGVVLEIGNLFICQVMSSHFCLDLMVELECTFDFGGTIAIASWLRSADELEGMTSEEPYAWRF